MTLSAIMESYMHTSLNDSMHRDTTIQFAGPFGVRSGLPYIGYDTRYKSENAKIVADCLRGKRPDLADDIWRTLLKISEYQSVNSQAAINRPLHITKTDIDILRFFGMDVATVLLMFEIYGITTTAPAMFFDDAESKGTFLCCMTTHLKPGVPKSQSVPLSQNALTFCNMAQATLQKGMIWNDGKLKLRSLSHTIASLLPGRPLTDLTDHPVLADKNLTIKSAEKEDGVWIVRTDYSPFSDDPISIIDLASQNIVGSKTH